MSAHIYMAGLIGMHRHACIRSGSIISLACFVLRRGAGDGNGGEQEGGGEEHPDGRVVEGAASY